MEVNFESHSLEKPEAEAEVEEDMRFHNSLQELKGLQSQLHHAADYCETTFLKSEAKKEFRIHSSYAMVVHVTCDRPCLHGKILMVKSFSSCVE